MFAILGRLRWAWGWVQETELLEGTEETLEGKRAKGARMSKVEVATVDVGLVCQANGGASH